MVNLDKPDLAMAKVTFRYIGRGRLGQLFYFLRAWCLMKECYLWGLLCRGDVGDVAEVVDLRVDMVNNTQLETRLRSRYSPLGEQCVLW